MQYESLQDAVIGTVQAYVSTVLQLAQKHGLQIWVHCVPSVLPETKQVVLLFNQTLKQLLQDAEQSSVWTAASDLSASGPLRGMTGQKEQQSGWVRFVDLDGDVLQQDACLEFDGTHLHPKYLVHLQAAMVCNSNS